MLRRGLVFVSVVLVLVTPSPVAATVAERTKAPDISVRTSLVAGSWEWPLRGAAALVEPYVHPAHEYAPGHRGIDMAPTQESVVFAPDAGIVAFAGRVVDRPVLTIDHGGGLVSTLEPVEATVEVGATVERGQPVGDVALGGHTAPGRLHLGARLDGVYVNPLVLLGGVPRAVLLPCCA